MPMTSVVGIFLKILRDPQNDNLKSPMLILLKLNLSVWKNIVLKQQMPDV